MAAFPTDLSFFRPVSRQDMGPIFESGKGPRSRPDSCVDSRPDSGFGESDPFFARSIPGLIKSIPLSQSPRESHISFRSFHPIMGKKSVENLKRKAIEQKLSLLSLRNQKEPILEAELKVIETDIDDYLFSASIEDIVELLQILSKNLNCYSLKFFKDALEELLSKSSCAHLSKYLILENLKLTPLGVSELLKFFEIKYSFPIDCIICLGHKELLKLIEEIATLPNDDLTRGFIVYDSSGDDFHFSPVFLQKKGGKIRILITDSMGQDYYVFKDGKTEGCLVFREIVHFLNENAYRFSFPFEIYTLKSLRQRDKGSCSLFSLLDIKNIFQRKDVRDIFEFINVNGQSNPILKDFNPRLQVFEFIYLPPDMMRETQSLSQLSEYERKSPAFRAFSPLAFIDASQAEKEKRELGKYVKDLRKSVDSTSRMSPCSELRMENRSMDKRKMEMITRLCMQVLKIKLI